MDKIKEIMDFFFLLDLANLDSFTDVQLCQNEALDPGLKQALSMCICVYTSAPACLFIGGKGTCWATWNPRGNRDRPSGTQGKVCHPTVLEN